MSTRRTLPSASTVSAACCREMDACSRRTWQSGPRPNTQRWCRLSTGSSSLPRTTPSLEMSTIRAAALSVALSAARARLASRSLLPASPPSAHRVLGHSVPGHSDKRMHEMYRQMSWICARHDKETPVHPSSPTFIARTAVSLQQRLLLGRTVPACLLVGRGQTCVAFATGATRQRLAFGYIQMAYAGALMGRNTRNRL